jgi:mono/diheme cytochrome c family protein
MKEPPMKTLPRLALLLLLLTGPALADEYDVTLKEGPGRNLVEVNCKRCHSLDYIQMNSPFLDRKGWDAEVTKMVKVMTAPVTPEDAQRIAEYLAASYGKQ